MAPSSGKSTSLPDRVALLYYKHGLFCASHPYSVILLTLAVAALCCSPLWRHPVLGSLSQQFSSPLNDASLLGNEQQTEESFTSRAPRWFHSAPVAYVQQIIVKSAVSPWQQNMIVTDAFRSPLAQVFQLVETINNFQVPDQVNGGASLSLDQLCLQVEEPLEGMPKDFLPQYACLTLSPAWIWRNDISRFRDDGNILKAIFEKKGYNSGSLQEILFGIPWSETGIKKFVLRTRQRILTYAVTLVFKNLNLNYISGLQKNLLERYPSSPSPATLDPENPNTVLNIYFEDQFTLAEFIPLGVTYIILFLYIYFSVSKLDLVKYKWVLAVSAVFTVMMSLLMSVGLCIFFGLNTTLNGSMSFSEILPYLVVVIGLENILVLTKSVVNTSAHQEVKIRIAQGLSKEGWSITKNLFMELALLTFAFFTFVPAIQEFCLFAVVGLLSDFFLQMLFFVTVLSIDIRRMEDGTKTNIPKNVTDDEEEDERSQDNLTSDVMNGPALRRSRFGFPRMRAPSVPYNTTPYSTSVFAPPTISPILSKLPKRLRFFHFWARTRMVQRGLMVGLVLWIFLLVYNSGLVEHLTENATQIAPNFHLQVPPVVQSFLGVTPPPESAAVPPPSGEYVDPPSSPGGDLNTPEHRLLQQTLFGKPLPPQHWTALFGFYNISLLGRYMSVLPPIHLSIPVSPTEALQWRHPAEADPTLRSFFLTYLDRFQESEEESASSQSPPLPLLPQFWSYRPTTVGEVLFAVALAFPTLVFVIYLFVLLYWCICPRHYAEWRSSWRHKSTKDLDPDTYLIMETLPITLKGHSQEVEDFINDENILCSVCLSGDVRVWDTMSGECLTVINRSTRHQSSQPTGSFSSDSTYGSSQQMDDVHPRPPLAFQWAHHSHHSVHHHLKEGHHRSADSGMSSPTAGTNEPQNQFHEPLNESPDSQVLNDSMAPEDSLPRGRREQLSPLEFQPVWCMASKTSWLVLGCGGGRIELWDVFTGLLLNVYNFSNVGVTALYLDTSRYQNGPAVPFRSKLYVARLNGVVEFLLIDVCGSSPEEEVQFPDLEEGLATQGKSREQAQLVWLHSLRAHTSPITVLTVFGGYLLTGSQDHLMKVFCCDTGTVIYTLYGHSGPISALHLDQVSPSWAASGCQEGHLCVWDLFTGTCVYNVQAHQGAVLSLATTPSYLVTLGANDLLCLWEKLQGHLLHSVRQHHLCPQLALLTNNIMVTANQNRLVLWDINYGEAVRVVPLNSSEPHLSIQRLKLVGRAIVCSFGRQLCVIHFPAMTEKGD